MTAVEWLHQFDPAASRQEIHGLLGQMLFSGEEGHKPTEALSGGETARLLFCRIMLQKPNVLVLDEPTNHLDLESINALNVALQKFEGTVLLVTHDQDLIEEVGTRVWHFDDGAIEDFKGTYEELDRLERRSTNMTSGQLPAHRRYRAGQASEGAGLRGMREGALPLGAPADLPDVRRDVVLRFLAQSPRNQPCEGKRPPGDRVSRAG